MHEVLAGLGSSNPVLGLDERVAIDASKELKRCLSCSANPVDLVHDELSLCAASLSAEGLESRRPLRPGANLPEHGLDVVSALPILPGLSSSEQGIHVSKLLLLNGRLKRRLLAARPLGLLILRLLALRATLLGPWHGQSQ